MKVVTQLAIFLANKPGTMAEVTRLLSSRGINILGVMVADAMDHAVLRMVVDKPDEAIHLLGDSGLLVLDNEIFALELPNKPGILSELGKRLADMGVNIEYAYGGVANGNTHGVLYLKASQPQVAQKVLKDY